MKFEMKGEFFSKNAAEKIHAELKKVVGEALQDEIVDIELRTTRRNVDANEQSFKPYSKMYRDFKAKAGRRGAVDMTFTGKMLGAMQWKFIQVSRAIVGAIYFSSTEEANKARIHNEGIGKMPKREFFGFTKNFVKNLEAKIKALKFKNL